MSSPDGPILSPDGQQRWTGTEWVPVPPEPTTTSATPAPSRETVAAPPNILPAQVPPSGASGTCYGFVFKMAREVRGGAIHFLHSEPETRVVQHTKREFMSTRSYKTTQKEELTNWSFFKTGIVPLVLYVLSLAVLLVGAAVWLIEAPTRAVFTSKK